MIVDVLNSGSDGNCTIITDSANNQIMLDCGINYENIIGKINIPTLNAILVSHFH